MPHSPLLGVGKNYVADFAEQAFTMDMMLRSLNIELKLIGYDKDAQRWVS